MSVRQLFIACLLGPFATLMFHSIHTFTMGWGEILDNWAFFLCVCGTNTREMILWQVEQIFFFILEPNIWHYFIIFSIWKIDWTFLSLYIHSKAMDKISYPPYMYLYKYIVITYSICVLRVLKPP